MLENTVKVTLKIRNDTASNWSSNNPILQLGELGLENDTSLLKVGDGSTAWNSLSYINKIDLQALVTGNTTAGNLIATAADGALIDSGIAAASVGVIPVATSGVLGGVQSGDGSNVPSDPGYNRIVVDNSGFMTLNHVSTSLLYVPSGDNLILDGGSSNGGVINGG